MQTNGTDTTNGTYTPALNHRYALPPFTDVFADEHGYSLLADLPGVAPDKLEISVDDGKLVVVGKRTAPADGKTEQELRRHFALPEDVDPTAIAAKLTDGVLEVTLPKRSELKPRRIAVATS